MREVARAMRSVQEAHPRITFDITSGDYDLTERLDKGLLDFGILVEPIDAQKYDHLKLPMSDTWGVLMHRDDPLASLDAVRPEDVRGRPLLCARQMLEGKVLSGWFGEDYDSLNIVGTFNLITTPSMMVEEGFGCTFTFDRLVDTTGERSLCFRPLEPRVETALYLVWKKYQTFTKAAALFLEEVRRTVL